jgi:hypothetical protein
VSGGVSGSGNAAAVLGDQRERVRVAWGVAWGVAVAGWQCVGWTERVTAVILSGDKPLFG